jgi:large conductance mechanosensitive channel
MGVGCSLYGLAAVYQYFSQDPIIKHTVKCKYCRKRINEKVSWPARLPRFKGWLLLTVVQALRCVNCSSWQDGREDVQAS